MVAENRDAGKIFVITEMPCIQAEKWAQRALSAIAKTGFVLDQEARDGGMMVMAALGFLAFLKADWVLVEPLLDEMFQCIKIKTPAMVRELTDDDIEEISTRVKLRDEVFDLHAGFSIAAVLSNLAAARSKTADLPDTPTSTQELEP